MLGRLRLIEQGIEATTF